jgi:type IV pilus assembly protein PilM
VNDLLTIDVGSRNIKIINGGVAPKNISVRNQILLDTPENAVANGFVVDFERIVDVIHGALEENNIREKKASCVITSPDVIIREIKLPKTNSKNLDIIVSNEMESFLADDNYSVQYFLQNQEDGVIKAYTFAAPTRVVEAYKKMLLTAGLIPVALDIGANSIRKLVSWGNLLKQQKEEQRMDIVADIGYSFINFNIFERKTLVYSRCVRLEIDEEIKKHVDTLRESSRTELELDVDFTSYLSKVGDEIQKVMQFLISSDFREREAKLFLCGGAANFSGVADLLREYLNKDAYLIESRRSPNFKSESLKEFICALGAQIRL